MKFFIPQKFLRCMRSSRIQCNVSFLDNTLAMHGIIFHSENVGMNEEAEKSPSTSCIMNSKYIYKKRTFLKQLKVLVQISVHFITETGFCKYTIGIKLSISIQQN